MEMEMEAKQRVIGRLDHVQGLAGDGQICESFAE